MAVKYLIYAGFVFRYINPLINEIIEMMKTETTPERRNIRLVIAFDGTAYSGWQTQSNAPSIQSVVTAALARVTCETVSLISSGRTDAGTHARGLVANFFTGSKIPADRLPFAVNNMLPRDIRLLAADDVPADFHARKKAQSKIYRYQIYQGIILPPHLLREYFHFPYPLDFDRMAEAARFFTGKHDFASYTKTSTRLVNTVRQIFRCDLRRQGARIYLTVEGNGFLRYMVRNMAGTLLEIGRGRISLPDFAAFFEKRDRTLAGFKAPAHGLVLVKVRY